MISFKEFIWNWEIQILPNKPKLIRVGQALMNYLATVWYEEYWRISSINYYDETNIDCFYNDELIPNTLKHLSNIWPKNNKIMTNLEKLEESVKLVIDAASTFRDEIVSEINSKAPVIVHERFCFELTRVMKKQPTEIIQNVPKAMKIMTALDILEELYPELKK